MSNSRKRNSKYLWKKTTTFINIYLVVSPRLLWSAAAHSDCRWQGGCKEQLALAGDDKDVVGLPLLWRLPRGSSMGGNRCSLHCKQVTLSYQNKVCVSMNLGISWQSHLSPLVWVIYQWIKAAGFHFNPSTRTAQCQRGALLRCKGLYPRCIIPTFHWKKSRALWK